MPISNDKKKIVIVGGGAGGLELMARLARNKRIFKSNTLTLVDRKLKHVWKPLLHEVATGTLLTTEDEIDYLSYADQRFQFEYGAFKGINRSEKHITIDATKDENNNIILPERAIPYDTLVFAIGSISNDYHIPGVKEHCVFLDSLEQAENLNKLLLKEILRLTNPLAKSAFNIAIIGGGATGVELAAEIHFALQEVTHLAIDAMPSFKITIVEASERILPQLPKRVSEAASHYLKNLGIDVLAKEAVTEVLGDGVKTKSGSFVPATLIIWAAGIKVESLTQHLDGLEINRLNQIVVQENLQTTTDPNIFAFGDCAACPQPNNQLVPPRAQAANQEAKLLAQTFVNMLANRPLKNYHYKDYGSLISISKYQYIGSLMGRFAKSLYIEGFIARFTYWLLYKKHQTVLFGFWRVFAMTIANAISKKIRPKLKLH